MFLKTRFTECLSVVVLMMAVSVCHAQPIVRKPSDVHQICRSDNKFVGKPLSVLLKEFELPIKLMYGRGGWVEEAPMFRLFFVNEESYTKCRKRDQFPLGLMVYVDRFFEWKTESGAERGFSTWTKQDEEKYGAFVVTAIRVAGQCETLEVGADVVSR